MVLGVGEVVSGGAAVILRTTNGWKRVNAFIERIRPAAEVNWFRVENENWANVYSEHASPLEDEEYYVYDDEGN